MIELRDITLAFGDRELMRGASATMRRGELVALLGRNGTGKSTLLRAIASLGRAQGGDVVIDGKPLADITSQELARKVAFVNTERVDVEALTAFDLVAIGRAPYTDWMGRLGEEDRVIVEQSLRLAGVENLMWRNVETLSDGECQRVMIARALAQQTDAILLDEPTSFLDLPNRYELCMLLQRLAHEQNKCILFSTHELDIALTLADSIALVDTPNLVYMPTREMVASGHIERLFNSDYISFDPDSHSIRLHR